MKIRHFCPFCAIPAISITVHISVTISNFQFLTVLNQFVLLLFVFINYLTYRSNNFVILYIYAEIKLTNLLNPKFISSVIKQSGYFDEEILEKVNNKYYTQTEFNNALTELSTKKTKPLHVFEYIFSVLSPLNLRYEN